MAINVNVTKLINCKPELASKIILDVEKYNNFLPWCNVKIVEQSKQETITDVAVDFGFYKYKFRCNFNEINNGSTKVIRVIGKKFMQFSFDGMWQISEYNNQTKILFTININFKIPFIENSLRNRIDGYVNEIVESFMSEMMRK